MSFSFFYSFLMLGCLCFVVRLVGLVDGAAVFMWGWIVCWIIALRMGHAKASFYLGKNNFS